LTRQLPYPEKTNIVVVETVAKGQLIGEIPEWTNVGTKQFLKKCFEYDPNQRISFKEIVEITSKMNKLR